MLDALASIAGHVEFVKNIANKGQQQKAVETEIQAIYESHKPINQSLTRIASHEDGAPEALLTIDGRDVHLEATVLETVAYATPSIKKKIYSCFDKFGRLRRYLQNESPFALAVIIPDFNVAANPTDGEAKEIENRIKQGEKFFEMTTPYGAIVYGAGMSLSPLRQRLSRDGMLFLVEYDECRYEIESTKPLNDRVLERIDEKQSQAKHSKIKLSDKGVRIYYFNLEAPTQIASDLDRPRIEGKLKMNELLIVSNSFSDNDGMKQIHDVYRHPDGPKLSVDFSNKFFKTTPPFKRINSNVWRAATGLIYREGERIVLVEARSDLPIGKGIRYRIARNKPHTPKK
jgi:hypothetical protein